MDFSTLSKHYGITRSYQKKSYIFKQGDEDKYLYFIHSGLLKAYYNDGSGKEYIKSFLFSGDNIASLQALQGGVCSFSLLCLQETQVLKIPYQTLRTAAAEDLAIAQSVIDLLLAFAMKKEQREYELLCLSAQQRYTALLARSPHVADVITQNDIARYLGITPVALSRIKNKRESS